MHDYNISITYINLGVQLRLRLSHGYRPLVIYPANIVIESYIYAGMPKSKKRQLLKNITRSIMILFTIAGLLWSKF